MEQEPGGSLNVGVIVDVVFAIAVIALAFGAVAEFQLRVGHIGAAADGAFVGVGGLPAGRWRQCKSLRRGREPAFPRLPEDIFFFTRFAFTCQEMGKMFRKSLPRYRK